MTLADRAAKKIPRTFLNWSGGIQYLLLSTWPRLLKNDRMKLRGEEDKVSTRMHHINAPCIRLPLSLSAQELNDPIHRVQSIGGQIDWLI